MPAGVEGFVPGRLKMAREAQTMRQAELAVAIERTPSTISKWENDDQFQRPEPAIFPRLAQALKVETSWFLKPLDQEHSASFFRSLIGELGMMRDKARARLGFVEAIEDAVSEHIDLPDVDIPDLMEGYDFLSLRHEDIEHIASALRDHWDLGDGPIDDLMVVIENAGIVAAEDHIGSPKLDGLSRWSLTKGRPFMLLAQDKRVAVRRRLDAAHELGHIVLHKRVSQRDLQENFKLIEDQAMAFAGAFLLPAETYEDDIFSLSLDAMLAVKAKWKVSVAAQIMRLWNLDKLSDEYRRRLFQYYNYRKWRAREPLDDELEVEQPQNLKDSIEMLLNERVVSGDELVREIGLSATDIAALTGVSEAHLRPPPENLVRFKPKLKEPASEAEGSTGVVVPLGERRR